MARIHIDPPLVPRNGNALDCVAVGRISTDHQDKLSLSDQDAMLKGFIEDNYDGRLEWHAIMTRGSGEFLDRAELLELEKLIESGKPDVVVCEDLARICRRTRAYDLCELAVDNGVRLIALNDHVDTAKPDWQLNAFFSVFRHESYNRDTAARIRRTQRNRFQNGGMVKTPLFCYIKAPGCKSDADLQKNMEMEWVVLGIFERLELGWSFSRIADWLNEHNIPVGPGCRRKTWDGATVRRVVYNPILKGTRVWNEKKSLRINKTGRRRQVAAPREDRLERNVPHLAFIEPARYDALVAKLVEQGERYSVPKRLGNDPRKGRPKKRTRWPGQHVYCQLCGQMFVYGGHGKKLHLMCSGAREYRCWNGVTFDTELAARRISEAVFEFVASLPDFEPAMLATIQEEAVQHQQAQRSRIQQLDREQEQTLREEQRLVEAVKKGGELDSLLNALTEVQAKRRGLGFERLQLEKQQPPPVELPNIDQIRCDVRVAFGELASDSLEFGDCMRQIIPRIIVYPVRLCDGGHPVLRARFEVDLSRYLPEGFRLRSLEQLLRTELTVDLFGMPQRAANREQVIALRSEGLTERQVASQLGLTITATQRAAALQRIMAQMGITDPYVPLTEPPEDYNRLRRHRHSRYRRRTAGQDEAA